jgi:hypothetical protein
MQVPAENVAFDMLDAVLVSQTILIVALDRLTCTETRVTPNPLDGTIVLKSLTPTLPLYTI